MRRRLFIIKKKNKTKKDRDTFSQRADAGTNLISTEMLLCFGGTCKSPAEIVNSLIIRAVSSRQRWKAPMSAFLLLSDNMSSGKFCPHSEIRSILFFCVPLLNVIVPAQQFPPHSARHNSGFTHIQTPLFLYSNNFFVFLIGHLYFLLLSKSSSFIQPEAWGAPLQTTVQAPTTAYS